MEDAMTVSGEQKVHARLEMAATVLMAVATIATAWCAYQSTVWGSEQEFALHQAAMLNREVDAHRNRARMEMMVHISQFISWAEATASSNTLMANYMESTFNPMLRSTVHEWRDLKPLQNPAAPRHPFAMKSYRLPADAKADSVQAVYDTTYQQALELNAHSEHYTLLTVVLASVLFFGGITSNLREVKTKIALVVGSALLLVGSVIWLLTFPMIIR